MNECRGGAARSDSLYDLSDIGWRLILSFLGLLSSFSIIPSNLSLNLRRVSISLSC